MFHESLAAAVNFKSIHTGFAVLSDASLIQLDRIAARAAYRISAIPIGHFAIPVTIEIARPANYFFASKRLIGICHRRSAREVAAAFSKPLLIRGSSALRTSPFMSFYRGSERLAVSDRCDWHFAVSRL